MNYWGMVAYGGMQLASLATMLGLAETSLPRGKELCSICLPNLNLPLCYSPSQHVTTPPSQDRPQNEYWEKQHALLELFISASLEFYGYPITSPWLIYTIRDN